MAWNSLVIGLLACLVLGSYESNAHFDRDIPVVNPSSKNTADADASGDASAKAKIHLNPDGGRSATAEATAGPEGNANAKAELSHGLGTSHNFDTNLGPFNGLGAPQGNSQNIGDYDQHQGYTDQPFDTNIPVENPSSKNTADADAFGDASAKANIHLNPDGGRSATAEAKAGPEGNANAKAELSHGLATSHNFDTNLGPFNGLGAPQRNSQNIGDYDQHQGYTDQPFDRDIPVESPSSKNTAVSDAVGDASAKADIHLNPDGGRSATAEAKAGPGGNANAKAVLSDGLGTSHNFDSHLRPFNRNRASQGNSQNIGDYDEHQGYTDRPVVSPESSYDTIDIRGLLDGGIIDTAKALREKAHDIGQGIVDHKTNLVKNVLNHLGLPTGGAHRAENSGLIENQDGVNKDSNDWNTFSRPAGSPFTGSQFTGPTSEVTGGIRGDQEVSDYYGSSNVDDDQTNETYKAMYSELLEEYVRLRHTGCNNGNVEYGAARNRCLSKTQRSRHEFPFGNGADVSYNNGQRGRNNGDASDAYYQDRLLRMSGYQGQGSARPTGNYEDDVRPVYYHGPTGSNRGTIGDNGGPYGSQDSRRYQYNTRNVNYDNSGQFPTEAYSTRRPQINPNTYQSGNQRMKNNGIPYGNDGLVAPNPLEHGGRGKIESSAGVNHNGGWSSSSASGGPGQSVSSSAFVSSGPNPVAWSKSRVHKRHAPNNYPHGPTPRTTVVGRNDEYGHGILTTQNGKGFDYNALDVNRGNSGPFPSPTYTTSRPNINPNSHQFGNQWNGNDDGSYGNREHSPQSYPNAYNTPRTIAGWNGLNPNNDYRRTHSNVAGPGKAESSVSSYGDVSSSVQSHGNGHAHSEASYHGQGIGSNNNGYNRGFYSARPRHRIGSRFGGFENSGTFDNAEGISAGSSASMDSNGHGEYTTYVKPYRPYF